VTTEQLHHHLSSAADDDTAPPTRVTAVDVYRSGLRRRTRRRWFTGAAAVATLAVATVGVTTVVTGPSGGGSQVGGVTQQDYTPADTKCRTVAATARDAAADTLPSDVTWGEPRFFADSAAEADCAGGGLFWIPFAHEGADWQLGFEGGTGMDDPGCDPSRQPVECQKIDGGEIGHLNSPDEYGVLYGRQGVFFFLGLSAADDQPLPDSKPFTTDQLAETAQAIATIFQ
jgi:hypothetical protein